MDNATNPETGQDKPPRLEDLWQFAGQGLRASDFNTAMIHLYRGEISRSNTWRSRLDATTNWAVVTTGAALTFTFGGLENTHLVIIADTLFVLFFLFIEARRYRYYELWTYRVRLIETNFYAGLLSPPFLPQADWANKIAESLRNPSFPITLGEAFGRRYRRNYAVIFLILALGWIVKVAIHPTPVPDLAEFVQRAAVGIVPGWLMILAGVLVQGALVLIGLLTFPLHKATGEVFTGEELTWQRRLSRIFHLATWEALEIDLPHIPIRPFIVPRQQLVYVISDNDEAISQAVLKELGRGVTRLEGTGMYTGNPHHVLLCVYTGNQAQTLKEIVRRIDPHAFVIITDVKEVRGSGFRPLEA
ncbi:MAG: hypothetical protein Fur0021_38100 [Candidatus Promineifilaceae bacterium]